MRQSKNCIDCNDDLVLLTYTSYPDIDGGRTDGSNLGRSLDLEMTQSTTSPSDPTTSVTTVDSADVTRSRRDLTSHLHVPGEAFVLFISFPLEKI